MVILSNFIKKHAPKILICSLVVFAVSVVFALKVGVKTNMENMLPKESKAYINEIEVSKYFDSNEQVVIVVTGDYNDSIESMHNINEKLNDSNTVLNVFYYVDFTPLGANALLFYDLEELQSIDFTTLDLSSNSIEYIKADNNNTFLMVAKPKIDMDDSSGSKKAFFDSLESTISEELSKYDSLDIGYTGGAFVQDYQADKVAFDSILVTTLIALFVIIAFLIIVFREIRFPFLSGYPLLLGVVITTAVTYFIYGNINMFSLAFAAVLFGLGIDFAIHIIISFKEHDHDLEKVLVKTGPSIIIGALSTSAAFLAFTFAKFTAFEQMGVISGVGIIILCIVMLLVVPSMMKVFSVKGSRVSKVVQQKQRTHTIKTVVIVVLLVLVLIPSVLSTKLNVNMNDIYPKEIEAFKWQKIVEEQFDYKLDTVNIIVPMTDDTMNNVNRLEDYDEISSVNSIYDYVPENQQNKINFLATRGIDTTSITVYDLPIELKNNYVGKENMQIVEIVPSIDVWEAENFDKISNTIYSETGAYPIGMPSMMNETSGYVKDDIVLISSLCLLFCFVLLIVSFKSIKIAFITLTPLLLTIYSLFGIANIIGIDFTLFSVVGIPIVIGIGIDSSVHIMYKLKNDLDVNKTMKAVMYTMITTVIGFGSIAISNHPGLSGLGQIVILGMVLSYLYNIFLLPRLFDLLNRNSKNMICDK